jgi:Family of unknown function (DUF6279)
MPAPASTTSRSLMSALTRRFVAAIALCALAGCGLNLLYPRLDSVVGFYLQDLVTLDDAQAAALSQTLAGNLEWHRRSELVRYASFLRDLAGEVESGAGREDWLAASRRTEEYWRDIFEQAAPGYTALARTFSDAQVDELLANLAREDEKTWHEFAERTPAQRDARREKTLARALERFTGPLTPTQRAAVRAHVASSPSFMAQWRVNRRVWREALAGALAQRTDGVEFERRMFVLIARPDDLWTPQYLAAVERRREALAVLMADIDAQLTPQQRAAARRQFLALADEVQGLAARRG